MEEGRKVGEMNETTVSQTELKALRRLREVVENLHMDWDSLQDWWPGDVFYMTDTAISALACYRKFLLKRARFPKA